jgi:hypothetical protein
MVPAWAVKATDNDDDEDDLNYASQFAGTYFSQVR